MGKFKIALLQAGNYCLVGKAMDESDDIPSMLNQARIPQRASWYKVNGRSTETHVGATLLTVDSSNWNLNNIELQMIDSSASFRLTRTETDKLKNWLI
jgi:hypothetical protein